MIWTLTYTGCLFFGVRSFLRPLNLLGVVGIAGICLVGIHGTGGTSSPSTSINSSILGLILSSDFLLLILIAPLILLLTLSMLGLGMGADFSVSSELMDHRDCCFWGEGVYENVDIFFKDRITPSRAASTDWLENEVLYFDGEVEPVVRIDDFRRRPGVASTCAGMLDGPECGIFDFDSGTVALAV